MSGCGKAGFELGKGGANRQRKTHRDTPSVTKSAVRRLARRGGMECITCVLFEEIRGRRRGEKGFGQRVVKRGRKLQMRKNLTGDSVTPVVQNAIRRLARRGGIDCFSCLMYEQTQGLLIEIKQDVDTDADSDTASDAVMDAVSEAESDATSHVVSADFNAPICDTIRCKGMSITCY